MNGVYVLHDMIFNDFAIKLKFQSSQQIVWKTSWLLFPEFLQQNEKQAAVLQLSPLLLFTLCGSIRVVTHTFICVVHQHRQPFLQTGERMLFWFWGIWTITTWDHRCQREAVIWVLQKRPRSAQHPVRPDASSRISESNRKTFILNSLLLIKIK